MGKMITEEEFINLSRKIHILLIIKSGLLEFHIPKQQKKFEKF